MSSLLKTNTNGFLQSLSATEMIKLNEKLYDRPYMKMVKFMQKIKQDVIDDLSENKKTNKKFFDNVRVEIIRYNYDGQLNELDMFIGTTCEIMISHCVESNIFDIAIEIACNERDCEDNDDYDVDPEYAVLFSVNGEDDIKKFFSELQKPNAISNATNIFAQVNNNILGERCADICNNLKISNDELLFLLCRLFSECMYECFKTDYYGYY